MKISVIIPVYNNLKLTKNCLSSISLSSCYFHEMELIVVDDGSSDGSEDYLSKFSTKNSWLIYHRNPANLKFARSCNAGASLARGEFLIFLNNDTQVTKNWDKSLLDTLEKDRDIWMAGAKLLYPDSTIQHAGVYLPELTGKSFGHVYSGFPASFPPANVEKELQCVTAACMIMRREDFQSLGGFDTAYLNGSEDIDLCLRIIKLGKKIIYQPECEVIHYESKSEGRFEHSKSNSELLYQRWKNKVKPDMAELIENDLVTCKEKGLLAEIGQISRATGWKELINLNPDLKINPAGNIAFTSRNVPVSFPLPEENDPGDEVFIDIDCCSREKIPAIVGYDTRAGYRNEKILKTVKPVYPGRNHLLFVLKTDFMSACASIRFDQAESPIEISSLTFYSFKNPDPKKPLLSVIYHPTTDPVSLNELVQYFAKSPKRAEVELIKAESETGPEFLNLLISSSKADYFLIIEKGMTVLPDFAIHAVETMELQPRVGFVYSDITLQTGDSARLVKFDFNPLNVLNKTLADTRGIFRKKSWYEAQGYTESLSCFINTDLFLGILSTGNWKSHRINYPAIGITGNERLFPPDCQAEANSIRAKHEKYLLKEAVKLNMKEKNQIGNQTL